MTGLDELEEAAIATAARMVGELGGFYPFACIVNGAGELEQLAADIGDPEPEVADVHEFIIGALSAGAAEGRYSAIALVLHERPPPELEIPEDRAIHAFVDSADAGARSVYVPYTEDGDGELHIGKIVRFERESHFFGSHDED